MRMKLVVSLLVLGLVVSVLGAISGAAARRNINVVDSVTWEIRPFIEITIGDSAFDFGKIGIGVDRIDVPEANTLYIRSNIAWNLSYRIGGVARRHLTVAVGRMTGRGDREVLVRYTLIDLRKMTPGEYTVTVTFTVTAR